MGCSNDGSRESLATSSDINELMQRKLDAALQRGYFRTVDLFAGGGGLSLGFQRAGFHSVASVELDPDARATHEANFSRLVPAGEYAAHGDITQIDPGEVVRHLGIPEAQAVDLVIGGPPCQAFSRLGRARLWELAGKEQAHRDDPRATMYTHFIGNVARLMPMAFVIENVREMGKFGGTNIAHEIAATAEELGYTTRYTILNAAWFGVPQLRERLIIVGIHQSLNVIPQFPAITHTYKVPTGYSSSRSGTGRIDVLEPHDYYVDHFAHVPRTRPATTAEEAFVDLPVLMHHLDGRTGKGHRRATSERMVHSAATNWFVEQMRHWPALESNGTSTGHVIRYTPRDYETFRRMPHGGMYPEALATAWEIFRERLAVEEKLRGSSIPEDSSDWAALRDSIVPPYLVNRYPNKFRKMWPDHPARTVPAHIGKDSYSHIHFDSNQARTISLREAARLQSFPDGFEFSGSMNSQLKQIGNAVPPLLAFAIATELSSLIRRTSNPKRTMGHEASQESLTPGTLA